MRTPSCSKYNKPQREVPQKSSPQILRADWPFSSGVVIEDRQSQQESRKRKRDCYADRSKPQTSNERSQRNKCSNRILNENVFPTTLAGKQPISYVGQRKRNRQDCESSENSARLLPLVAE